MTPSTCNLDQHITPNHWTVAQFQPFGGLSPDQEFDLVAPIHIYFSADMRFEERARSAAQELKRLGHPLLAELDVDEVIASTTSLANCDSRYNALMMAIAESECPGIESYIDEHGAFAFRHNGEDAILAGDDSGTFAFYSDAKAVRRRLQGEQMM